MIASLEGIVVDAGADYVIVKVGGVGFRVYVPDGVLQGQEKNRGKPGTSIHLFTHLHVRENELALYGCLSRDELELFQLLLGVSGIGPKTALAALSSLTPSSLRGAIAQEQVEVLARVPGLGPKTARRVIFQLQDKIAEATQALSPLSDQDAEVIAALTSLGYSVVEAQTALQNLPRDPDLSLEEQIRLSLAYFG
jgi:holliday junction DNA helicase RuvA